MLSCRAAVGAGGRLGSTGGDKSFAMAVKSRQHAAAVELVTRPMCPSTALICFLVQRAMSGWREWMAAWSHCPAQRRAIRVGWLKVERSSWNFLPKSIIGPGGSRLTVRLRSDEPSIRAPALLGQSQSTWACVQCLRQIGKILWQACWIHLGANWSLCFNAEGHRNYFFCLLPLHLRICSFCMFCALLLRNFRGALPCSKRIIFRWSVDA